MPNYKCIIFDCDGVLVDSEPLANQVMVDMANELGASITLDYAYQHFKGNSFTNCAKHLAELIPAEIPPHFESEYRKRSFEKFKNEIKPIDGVLDLVRSLRVPFCVASSGPVSKVKLNLDLTGLLPYFKSKIFSCYTIKKWKPDPAVFLWAAETMGFQPSDCLVIEDSSIGVMAAIHGGFDVYGFIEHDYKNELEALATATFKSMSELKQLLN